MAMSSWSVLISLILPISYCQQQRLMITGVFDAPSIGPEIALRGIELFAILNIDDLSNYGIGVASNGGGTDGEEYTFPPDSLTKGDFIYVTNNNQSFETYFQSTSYVLYDTNEVNSLGGNDAVELYYNGAVIDLFGDPDVDGSAACWEYSDSWGYRVNGSQPSDVYDSTCDTWIIAAIDELAGTDFNSEATNPFPIGTFIGPELEPSISPSSVPTSNPSLIPTENPTIESTAPDTTMPDTTEADTTEADTTMAVAEEMTTTMAQMQSDMTTTTMINNEPDDDMTTTMMVDDDGDMDMETTMDSVEMDMDSTMPDSDDNQPEADGDIADRVRIGVIILALTWVVCIIM